jgi:hypothetical protein
MVRAPWTLAVALFAISVIAWVVAAERPPKSPVRIEAARTLAADPDLRLVSERSPYMRTDGDERTGAQPLTLLLLVVLAPPATKIPNHGRPVCR